MGVLTFDGQTNDDFTLMIAALNNNELKDLEDTITIKCQALNEDQTSELLAALLSYRSPRLNISFSQTNDMLEQQVMSVLRSTTEQFETIDLNFAGMEVKLGKHQQNEAPSFSDQLSELTSQFSGFGMSSGLGMLSSLRDTVYAHTPFIPGFDASMLRQLNCFARPDLEGDADAPAPETKKK